MGMLYIIFVVAFAIAIGSVTYNRHSIEADEEMDRTIEEILSH